LFPIHRLPGIGGLLLGPGIAFAGFQVVKGGVDNFVCYGFVVREFAGQVIEWFVEPSEIMPQGLFISPTKLIGPVVFVFSLFLLQLKKLG